MGLRLILPFLIDLPITRRTATTLTIMVVVVAGAGYWLARVRPQSNLLRDFACISA